jgi:hypothetical protein
VHDDTHSQFLERSAASTDQGAEQRRPRRISDRSNEHVARAKAARVSGVEDDTRSALGTPGHPGMPSSTSPDTTAAADVPATSQLSIGGTVVSMMNGATRPNNRECSVACASMRSLFAPGSTRYSVNSSTLSRQRFQRSPARLREHHHGGQRLFELESVDAIEFAAQFGYRGVAGYCEGHQVACWRTIGSNGRIVQSGVAVISEREPNEPAVAFDSVDSRVDQFVRGERRQEPKASETLQVCRRKSLAVIVQSLPHLGEHRTRADDREADGSRFQFEKQCLSEIGEPAFDPE